MTAEDTCPDARRENHVLSPEVSLGKRGARPTEPVSLGVVPFSDA